jgi:hypothetical protein
MPIRTETAIGFKTLYHNMSPRESYRRAKSHMVKFLSKQRLCAVQGVRYKRRSLLVENRTEGGRERV